MILGNCQHCTARERQARRELLEMRRRRCVRDMEERQKEIDEIDKQIEVMELREQNEPLVSRDLIAGLDQLEQAIIREA